MDRISAIKRESTRNGFERKRKREGNGLVIERRRKEMEHHRDKEKRE